MGFATFLMGAMTSRTGTCRCCSYAETAMSQMPLPGAMYFSGDEYVGVYSNIAGQNVTSGRRLWPWRYCTNHSFHFFRRLGGHGPVCSIKLRFDDEDHTEDIFYFAIM
jgi:hypothetical protein